jgi:hypothetical protein
MQYLFNLQHNTTKTGVQQRMHLTAYKESATATTREIERLRHENAILRNGARPPSEHDHTHMLLDITREKVDIRTHGIIHFEHHMEAQDAELEERVEMITNLEQQLLELQVQAPPEPADLEEIDAMSGVDED